ASVATLKIGILITGEPDAEPTRRSAQSLEEHGVTAKVFSGTTFAAVLEAALAAGCDVIACVRPGDTLAPNALAYALEGFALPQAQVVYTDSEQNGQPWFKPAWNIDYALATDYPLDLRLVRAALAKDLRQAGNAAEFGWSALAAAHAVGEAAIVHVPRVLY
ncbi:hypothetical protein, partial [Bacillus amyloliquefaciens]|uniref:hypothetical protein n=1 Tax=Bacillus amyloliquefaciens TaxID=1390 RepID=UPI0023ECDBDC